MNEQKIYAVEEKISNANMLLNEIKSHYGEDECYGQNASFEQRHSDYQKLLIAIEILHNCQNKIEDYITDILEYNKKFPEADTHRIETIKILLEMDEKDLKNLRTYSHVVYKKGEAKS